MSDDGLESMLASIRRLHERVRDTVIEASERLSLDQLSAVADDSDEGDTIYAIDRVSEDLLVEIFEQEVASQTSFVLIAEGIKGGKIVLPRGTTDADAEWRIIVDPIDGTRGLMYQKRSAWILTGVARNRGIGNESCRTLSWPCKLKSRWSSNISVMLSGR